MRRLLLILPIVAAGYFGWTQYHSPSVPESRASGIESSGDAECARALAARASGVRVQGRGIVTKILPDDNEGSRHQRFVVRLQSGQTLLIAHNIDIASRIGSLRVGDTVGFSGEYAWNAKGGVVHWTHRNPAGRHAGGWLEHQNRTYQ